MAEPRRDPETSDAGGSDVGPERVSAPGTPGWVKAFGLVVIVLIVVLIAAQLLFGVQHGPSLH